MHLTLVCGLSFAGKSTLAAELGAEMSAVVVSLDAINAERGLHGGQGIPLGEWAKTNQMARERVSAALRLGQSVVVDDTSPRFIRDDWRAIADAVAASFSLVWVQIDAELQRQRVLANRNNLHRPDVIDEVLHAHRASFEPPAEDEAAIEVSAYDTRAPETVRLIAEAILG